MGEVKLFVRSSPKLVTPGDDNYSWEEAVARQTKPNLIDRVVLLFKPWRTVIAPESMPAAITTMDRKPIYRYKEMGCSVYYLGPAPSPGFPGR